MKKKESKSKSKADKSPPRKTKKKKNDDDDDSEEDIKKTFLVGQKFVTPADVSILRIKKTNVNRTIHFLLFIQVYLIKIQKVKWQRNGAWKMEL